MQRRHRETILCSRRVCSPVAARAVKEPRASSRATPGIAHNHSGAHPHPELKPVSVRFSGILRSTLVAGCAVLALSIAGLNADVSTTAPTTLPTTAPATLPVATTAPVATSSAVDNLIKQLGSDDADDRDSAQKQLVGLGQQAIPALKKAADENEDPEIRSRAAAALAQMKDLDSNGVSLITIHVKDAPAQDVFNTIGAQSHATIQTFNTRAMGGAINNPTLTLDAEHKPFWDVMTDVCTQLNVCPMIDLTSNKNTMQLMVTPRNWMAQSPHQIVGPFWVGVTSLYRQRSIDLRGPEQVTDRFAVQLTVLPEPKLSVTKMSEFTVKEAADDAGHSLLPRADTTLANQMLRSARQMNHTIESQLYYPPEGAGKKIAILRGEVNAMVAQDMQQFQIDDVLGTPRITNPLTGCKIDATVTRQGTDFFRVVLHCSRENLTEDQWSAMYNRMNDLTLEDADGHALTGFQNNNQMTENNGVSSFTANCLFSRNMIGGLPLNRQVVKVGDPTKLTWNVATSVKPMLIAVTFKDLPMP